MTYGQSGEGAKSSVEVNNQVNESATQQDWFDRLRFAHTGARDDIMGMHGKTSDEVMWLRTPNPSKQPEYEYLLVSPCCQVYKDKRIFWIS